MLEDQKKIKEVDEEENKPAGRLFVNTLGNLFGNDKAPKTSLLFGNELASGSSLFNKKPTESTLFGDKPRESLFDKQDSINGKSFG